jgi:hypothetical protein
MRGKVTKLRRRVGRALALAGVSCLVAVAAEGQGRWPEREVGASTGGGLMTVEMTLGATTPTVVCRGDTLGLEVEVRNPSDEPLEFEKSALWRQFNYIYRQPDRLTRHGDTITGLGEGGERVAEGDVPRETVVIAPGEALRFRGEFSLKDKFFKRAGSYELLVGVARVPSSRLSFEIMDCGHLDSEEK